MQIVINNPSLEGQLILKSKELKIQLDDLIEHILSDGINDDKLFKIDEPYILKTFENIKRGNTKEFKEISPKDLFKEIGIY